MKSRGGLAIGSTGTFPGGPVTNGPMDGCFFILLLFNYFLFNLPCLAFPCLLLYLFRPGERDMHRLGPQCSAADTAERWRLAQWLVCLKNTWPNGPMRGYRGPGVPPTHVLDPLTYSTLFLYFHVQVCDRRQVQFIISCGDDLTKTPSSPVSPAHP